MKFWVLIANNDLSGFPTKISEALFESMTESQQKNGLVAEIIFSHLEETTSEKEIVP